METYDFKLRRHESFSIREGWFQKALNFAAANKGINIFSSGIENLGIGSNMVKSLKYWLTSSGLIDEHSKNTELSEFGNLVLKYDRYLENPFTWYLIHLKLCLFTENAPLFGYLFNSNLKKFTKGEILDEIYGIMKSRSRKDELRKDYVEADLQIALKSYIKDTFDSNPEDNYACPLSELNLLKKNKDTYERVKPSFSAISFLIIYYNLTEIYRGEKSFIIEDCISKECSPCRIFNLDKNTFVQYLEEMQKKGLITINKTAGLNTVYFEKCLNLSNIFKCYSWGE